jgi:hypothetical protein
VKYDKLNNSNTPVGLKANNGTMALSQMNSLTGEQNYDEIRKNIALKKQFTVAVVVLEDDLMCHEFQAPVLQS